MPYFKVKSMETACNETAVAAQKMTRSAGEIEISCLMFQAELPKTMLSVDVAAREFTQVADSLQSVLHPFGGRKSQSIDKSKELIKPQQQKVQPSAKPQQITTSSTNAPTGRSQGQVPQESAAYQNKNQQVLKDTDKSMQQRQSNIQSESQTRYYQKQKDQMQEKSKEAYVNYKQKQQSSYDKQKEYTVAMYQQESLDNFSKLSEAMQRQYQQSQLNELGLQTQDMELLDAIRSALVHQYIKILTQQLIEKGYFKVIQEEQPDLSGMQDDSVVKIYRQNGEYAKRPQSEDSQKFQVTEEPEQKQDGNWFQNFQNTQKEWANNFQKSWGGFTNDAGHFFNNVNPWRKKEEEQKEQLPPVQAKTPPTINMSTQSDDKQVAQTASSAAPPKTPAAASPIAALSQQNQEKVPASKGSDESTSSPKKYTIQTADGKFCEVEESQAFGQDQKQLLPELFYNFNVNEAQNGGNGSSVSLGNLSKQTQPFQKNKSVNKVVVNQDFMQQPHFNTGQEEAGTQTDLDTTSFFQNDTLDKLKHLNDNEEMKEAAQNTVRNLQKLSNMDELTRVQNVKQIIGDLQDKNDDQDSQSNNG